MTFAYLKNNKTQEMEFVHFSEFMSNLQDYDEIMEYLNSPVNIESLTEWNNFLEENYNPMEDEFNS